MNFSRQALLGIGMVLGGIVMLSALVQQLGGTDDQVLTPAIADKADAIADASTPFTLDVDTEKRLLAEKQQQRARRVAEQEKQAKLFAEAQASAEAQALAKARTENQQYNTSSKPIEAEDERPTNTQSDVVYPQLQARVDANAQKAEQKEANKQKEAKKKDEVKKKDEAKAATKQKPAAAEKTENKDKKLPPKAAVDYTIKEGDGLLKLSRQYNVPVAAIAQANKIEPSATLQIGQVLVVPSRKQIERLQREAAVAEKARAEKREEKRKKEEALAKKSVDAKKDAQKNLVAARKEVKETDAKGSFGVQVALATNQESADKLAEKFKAAGYEVKTSKTSRGVRVVVGPERGKLAALALKDKVNSDPEVNTTSAWVLYW